MKEPVLIKPDGTRVDGRKANELRPLKMEIGVLEKSDGSAYLEQGGTKVFAAVFGPKEMHPKHLALPSRAVLNMRYHMASFSVEERKSLGMTRREIELSKVARQALESVVFLEEFPRSSIDVFAEIVQADGGTRCAAITASSLALADAGIPMLDLLPAVAVGKIGGKIVLDPCDVEDKYGEADMPVAISQRLNAALLFQLNGRLSLDEFDEAWELARQGCSQIYEMQRNALKNRYETYRPEEGT